MARKQLSWNKRIRQRLLRVKRQWEFYRHPPLSWQVTWIMQWQMRKLMLRQAICFIKGA